MEKNCNRCDHCIIVSILPKKPLEEIRSDTSTFTDAKVKKIYCRKEQWKNAAGLQVVYSSLNVFEAVGAGEKFAKNCEFFEGEDD